MYHRFGPGSPRKIHSDISPTTPLTFTAVKSAKFGLDFRLSRFKALWSRSEATCVKSKKDIGMIGNGNDILTSLQLYIARLRFISTRICCCIMSPRRMQNCPNPLPVKFKMFDVAKIGRIEIIIPVTPPRII